MILDEQDSYWLLHRVRPFSSRTTLSLRPSRTSSATLSPIVVRAQFAERSGQNGEVGNFLVQLLNLTALVFLARALLSWFRPQPGSPIWPIADAIYRGTEPVLAPVRRILPPMGGLDLSVIVVILGIQWLLIPLVARL